MAVAAVSTLLALIYLRVSTEDQAKEGYSLPEQRRLCLQKADALTADLNRQGAPVQLQSIVFEDTVSGELLQRPVLTEVREFIRAHKPAYFICLDPDRFSRNLTNQLLVTHEIEAAGCQLEFVQHNYQRTPEGILFYQLRGAISEFEKKKINERTTRGRHGKMRQGKLASNVTIYGYRYNKETGQLDIYEPEARWVRQMYEWAAEGKGPSEVAAELRAMGVPTRKSTVWYTSTVRSILTNESYTGTMHCNRWDWTGATALAQLPKPLRDRPITRKERPKESWIPVPIPALIEPGLWTRVQARFRRLKRETQRGKGLLSGLVTCGLCGGAVNYITNTSNGSYNLRCKLRYPVKLDRKVALDRACELPNVRAKFIEERVWSEITGWILDPETIARRLERQDAGAQPAGEQDRLTQEIASLDAELNQRKTEHASTLAMVVSGRVIREVGDQLLDQQREQIEHLTRAVTAKRQQQAAMAETAAAAPAVRLRLVQMRDRFAALSGRLEQTLNNLPPDRRREIVRDLVDSVVLRPGRTCDVLPKRPV